MNSGAPKTRNIVDRRYNVEAFACIGKYVVYSGHAYTKTRCEQTQKWKPQQKIVVYLC